MKRKLSDDFLKTLAELRAKELFTREFFETCTDSWYGDEFFRFKGEVTFNGKLLKPSDNDAYKYMGWLQDYKNSYQDNYYATENAMGLYHAIIDYLHEIIDNIDEGKKRYKAFECDPEIIAKLKFVGNYFVDKYNSEYAIYKSTHKDAK
jgi:hypothetical protein